MPQIKHINKRLDNRRQYITEVSYGTDNTISRGYTRDISLGGVFITADHNIPLSADILITMPFPTSTRCVSLRGTVVRVVSDGFAISFKLPERKYCQDFGQYWQTPWTAA